MSSEPFHHRFRFSLRELLGFMSAVCVTSALTQMEMLWSSAIFVAVIAVSGFFVEHRTWRCIAYGAIAGIVCGILLMFAYTRFELGFVFGSPRSAESFAAAQIVLAWRSYIVHFGAMGGATLALIIFGRADAQFQPFLSDNG